MTAATAALSSLYRGWVAHRETQVAATGLTDPAEIAARLDMTVEAARAYLDRVSHASPGAGECSPVAGGAGEAPSRPATSAGSRFLLSPPCEPCDRGMVPPVTRAREGSITRVKAR